ncbi:hypothetical protein N7U66_11150 [Lacinutrix neustonica]|uniref:Uncharacterized protein n=1 Tax=Lacinutrix neustonica TaxID=2980107 RepID=A0A9E8SC18_9FLAO|nr:hypothetical protein [Lacinutrix neustonica]WAC00828.1 hypothetical protein N7U66_11150 [Lacinutrix neustonica]
MTMVFGFRDNTIRYTLEPTDYDFAAAALLNEPGFEAPAASVANYGNFDRRVGNSAYWSDDMVVTALGIILNNIDPSASEEQKYIVTVDIYNGSNTTEDFSVIKTGGEWVAN